MNGRGFSTSNTTKPPSHLSDVAPLARAWGSLAHPDGGFEDFSGSKIAPRL